MLVVRRLGRDIPLVPGRDEWWDEATAAAEPMTETPVFDAETPCVLLYSSGSTGRPKGCLHTHAGLPFKFAQEARHGFGMDVGERLMWVTDMGWVMGAYVVTAAFTNGGTAVLYEGTPDHPTPDRLWSVAERHRVTALGVSPPPSSGSSPVSVTGGRTPTRSPTCGSSAAPGSRGTWSPGGGASATSARAAPPSST
ncbi:AMP-binding protein [Nonomuraea ferruginea]